MARAKKRVEEKPHVVYAGYAGAVSRFLDVAGEQVHDLSTDLSKHEQEFIKFKQLTSDIDKGNLCLTRRRCE